MLGTAGHIDHGKTTLVAALTGIDTDRLPEEKRRGITIELGFAPWRISPELEASIVDVPGHEGFVRTMVAGAGGIDAVMLVVSAEDGVMPQTREHVNVCRLLGVAGGVVALTKVDRLGDDPDAIELAADDVQAALADTPFAGAPIVPCSAVTGAGLDALRDAVRTLAAALPRRDASGPVILPLDRVFTIKGHGTVVTGTLLSGSIDLRADEELVLVPGGEGREPRPVRARAAQVRLEGRERIGAGNRVALNLAIEASAVERGDVVARGSMVARQSIVHARVHHLAGHDAPWRAGTTVQVCAGTAHGIGVLDPLWVVPKDGEPDDGVAPGRDALVRIRLQTPLPCWRGQRIVLRAFDEPDVRTGRTVGGGVIVDPEPSTGRSQRPRWIALGRALEQADPLARLSALLDDAGAEGIASDVLARRAGVHDPAQALARRTAKGGDVVALPGGRFVLEPLLRPIGEAAIAIVDRFHAANPLQAGMPRPVLEAKLDDPRRARVAADIASAAIERAIERRVLRAVDEQGTIARPGKGMQAGGEPSGHMKAVLERYQQGGITPPTLREIGDGTGLPPADVLEIVGALQRVGRLVKITDELSLARDVHDELVARIRKHLAEAGTIDVQALKQLTGLTRKFAVPLLEHMDGLQVTLRRGDTRIPGPKA